MFLIISSLVCCAIAQNISYNLPEHVGQDKLKIGEAAVGGMVPTAFIIILAAILRIIQLYKQRKEQQRYKVTEV